MSRTITLDSSARFTRTRGRNDAASPTYRVVSNRLEALAVASAALPFLPKHSTVAGRMSPYSAAERNIVGLVRLAARSGATVAEIAGATGQTREWAKARISAYTPAHRGSNVWGN